jgi:glycosyltransferase involved in cell wall biosynthesis
VRRTDYPNLELVVADDGSPEWMHTRIHMLPFHKFVLAKKNRGLGANTNAGLRACTGRYILSLQDDWECRGPSGYLRDAVELLERHPEIGLVRFYGLDYPDRDLVPLATTAEPCCSILPDPLCESLTRTLYSDTPHLKSRQFVDLLGFYKEGCTMEDCERDYQGRFLLQHRMAAALFPQYYNSVFVHIGEKESLRTNTPRHRFESFLTPYAKWLQPRSSTLFNLSKDLYKKVEATLVRVGVFR